MRRMPYDDYSRHELILRDWLAMDRTTYAGARTFMGYLRTFLTIVIASIIFVHVFHGDAFDDLFYFGFLLGLVVLAAGTSIYMDIRSHHRDLLRLDAEEPNPPKTEK